ncbi:DUF5811 family protein [Halomicroarcula sp. GCM10025710]
MKNVHVWKLAVRRRDRASDAHRGATRPARKDLASVAARTRELLPSEFVVGSEIHNSETGPRATIAVQPPVGSVVSADYRPEDAESSSITSDERDELAQGIAASAALQVKQVMGDDTAPTAQ